MMVSRDVAICMTAFIVIYAINKKVAMLLAAFIVLLSVLRT